MDEENIISKTHNYCKELFQWSIQDTHVVLRPKQRNNTIPGVHDWGCRKWTGQITQGILTEKMSRESKQVIPFKMGCKIHCSWTGTLKFPQVSLLYLLYQSLIWKLKLPVFVCFQKARHTTCCFFKCLSSDQS